MTLSVIRHRSSSPKRRSLTKRRSSTKRRSLTKRRSSTKRRSTKHRSSTKRRSTKHRSTKRRSTKHRSTKRRSAISFRFNTPVRNRRSSSERRERLAYARSMNLAKLRTLSPKSQAAYLNRATLFARKN